MVSCVRGFDDGEETWWVIRDPQNGIFDLIFAIPVQLGVALCGYRVDGGEGLEEPDFVELQPPRRAGLLARLFARA